MLGSTEKAINWGLFLSFWCLEGGVFAQSSSLPLERIGDFENPYSDRIFTHDMVLPWKSEVPSKKYWGRVFLAITYKHESGQEFIRNYTLYDDGLHDDGRLGDAVFGNHIPITSDLPLGNYTYDYREWSEVFGYSANARDRPLKIIPVVPGQCQELPNYPYQTNSSNPTTIAILGVNLGDSSSGVFVPDWNTLFETAANQLYNFDVSFLNREPMKSYRSHFKAMYINQMYTGNRSILREGAHALEFFYEYMLSRCPYNMNFFLIADPEISLPSENYPQPVPIGKQPDHVTHEFGHRAANLNDEYQNKFICTDDKKVPFNEKDKALFPFGFNTYHATSDTNNQAACEANADWHYLVGSCYLNEKVYFGNCPNTSEGRDVAVSCHHGSFYCGTDAYFWRPALRTVMRIPSAKSSLVDITELCKSFDHVVGQRVGVCDRICLDGCENGYDCLDPDGDGEGQCCQNGTCLPNPKDVAPGHPINFGLFR